MRRGAPAARHARGARQVPPPGRRAGGVAPRLIRQIQQQGLLQELPRGSSRAGLDVLTRHHCVAQAQSVHAALLEFAATEGIDIMILGEGDLPILFAYVWARTARCAPLAQRHSQGAGSNTMPHLHPRATLFGTIWCWGNAGAGSKENKGTVQKLVAPGGITNSTSDTVKSKCKCPCLIIRPAVRRPWLGHGAARCYAQCTPGH